MKTKLSSKVYRLFVMVSCVSVIFSVQLVAPIGASTSERAAVVAGMQALFICDSVFVAGRSVQEVVQDELQGIEGGMPGGSKLYYQPQVYYRDRYVSLRYSEDEDPRIAVFRDGMACTVLPIGSTKEDIAKLPRVKLPPTTIDPAKVPWPDGDVTPATPPTFSNVDMKTLLKVVEAAFSPETAYGIGTLTNGVVVVYKGQIIAEHYRTGFDRYTQYRTWSTAKSISNAIVGIMLKEGLIKSIYDRVPIPEWQGPTDRRKEITFDHLMHMSSGLQTLVPSDGSQTDRCYFSGIDCAADASALPSLNEPNKKYHYSNYDVLLAVRALRLILNDDQKYLTYPYKNLFYKIGMLSTVAGGDPYGNFILSSGIQTTPRDLARFGLLYLRDGVWNGERILPEGWVKYSITPAATKEDGRYGAWWWLFNEGGKQNSKVLSVPVFHTSGWRGQVVAVVPNQDLIIARMGIDNTERSECKFNVEQFIADIVATIK